MKLGAWVVMLLGLIMFLTLIGFNTGLTYILNDFGIGVTDSQISSGDIENSGFWEYVFGIEGFLTTFAISTAIVVGLYVKTADTNLFVVPILTSVGNIFGGTFYGIIKLVADYGQVWATSIVGLVFGLLAAGFIFACFDYFLGR
jgi:hypothetical protein